MGILDSLFNDSQELKIWCPVCQTNKGHINPCPPLKPTLKVEKDTGLIVNLMSTDSAKAVEGKVKKAIEQYKNPIDGEYEVVTDKKALAELERKNVEG